MDLSQGESGMTHGFYLIGTTTGGVSLSEKLTILFPACEISGLSMLESLMANIKIEKLYTHTDTTILPLTIDDLLDKLVLDPISKKCFIFGMKIIKLNPIHDNLVIDS